MDIMNQSTSSFHSMKQLDEDQQQKLQKQAARPFIVGAGRTGSAQRQPSGQRKQPPSHQNRVAPNSLVGKNITGAAGKAKSGADEFEGLLEEAGIHSEATQSRADILRMLERRERDAEELDLESCFSEMRSKVAGAN